MKEESTRGQREAAKYRGVMIFGGNGSGKTTLGRALAARLGYKHLDHEAYCFEKTDPPYTVSRPFREYTQCMLADIQASHGFVLSSVRGDFGQEIQSQYDLAICIDLPLELRLARVKQRNIEKFGDRARPGGDLYEQQNRFVDFVAKRSLDTMEEWARSLACPVITVDGRKTVDSLLQQILEHIQDARGSIAP